MKDEKKNMPLLSEKEMAQVEAAMARVSSETAGTVKRIEDTQRGWTAGIGAVNRKVSVVMENQAADYFAWDMEPEKARDFANAVLAQADRAEGKEPS